MLKNNTAKREILFWGFNHLLGMFDQIKDYPEANQIELRRLLQASITFWVKCLHERLIVIVNNTKKQVVSDVHGLIDDSARIFVDAAKLYAKFQTVAPPPELLSDAAALAEKLTPCAHAVLDLIYNTVNVVSERDEFLKTVEGVIEKIERHREIIGRSLIIDEMVRDYGNLLTEEEKRQRHKKELVTDLAAFVLGGVPGLVAKKIGLNPIAKLLKK